MAFQGKAIQLVDEKQNILFMQAVNQEVFERISRILELTRDAEVSLPILDKVIDKLELPKKQLTQKIAMKIAKAKNLEESLSKALMTMRMKDLQEMAKDVESLEIERKPYRDCLTVKTKEKSWTLPL